MPLHLLGFSGSLRARSYNTALLRACEELLPKGAALELFDLAPLPMYNDDVRQRGFPDCVQDFRARISRADALLITTPEYNHSISGALKNALNWASRNDHGHQPLSWKPVAIMSVATGGFGAARAQDHLRDILASTNCYAVNKPQVMITYADKKFDENLRLTDETTRGFVQQLLLALAEFAPRFADKHAAQPAHT